MTNINILKENEISLFDFPPQFSEEERKQYFILPDEDVKFKKLETKIGYILQEGYFISRNSFFRPNQYYVEDIKYAASLCGINREIKIENYYSRAIHNVHKQIILEKFRVKSFSDCKDLFEREAQELVKSSLKPREIFYTLLDFLIKEHIEIPRYYSFAEIITKSLNHFENDLITVIDDKLTIDQKNILDGFMSLSVDNNIEVSAKNPYLITHLKRVVQGISPSKIRQSLNDFHYIKDLHEELKDFFASNVVSNELINYYAIWVLKVEHVHFEDIKDIRSKRLYVTSFISYQYKIRQDYFVDTFLQTIQKYYNDTENNVAQHFLNPDIKYRRNESFVKIRNLMSSKNEPLNRIWEIIYSKKFITSDEKLELIKGVFSNGNFDLRKKILDELEKLENTGVKNIKDQLFYEELYKGYKKIANRVAKILLIFQFNSQSSNPEIYQAIKYYQEKKGKIKEHDAPLDFINRNEWKWLYSEYKEFNTELYKIFLFKAVFDGIKSGALNLLFSERYKSVDDYLIDSKRWEENKEELVSRSALNELNKDPNEILNYLNSLLYDQYSTTNDNIRHNEFIKFTSKGVPKVVTPKNSDSGDSNTITITDFIDQDILIPLTQILSDVAYYSDYILSFTHYIRKNVRSEPSYESIYAAIIALGCNIEVRKMGKISDGIGADKLDYIVRWFFSKKNIENANRKIVSLINTLPLSNIYLDNKNQINTSSDGQKFNVGIASLNATYSSKYFGTGKGVSAYSSIDAKGRLIYGTVMSASERESNFVVDALFHNEDIISDTHSTDTHGYTEIIFGICHLLDVQFTPRIKNYHEQLLYTFKSKSRKYYESLKYKILPEKSKYINEKIIIEQWDQILRFLCTVKLRETLPSNILKRLSSYSKQHPLHKALKEVGRIYKTLFLLKYYDKVPLRQNIEKQLNRIELSHLFAKAVFFGGNQEFNYATKEEQDIALGCRQLIQNAIVLWNYLYISEKLSQIEDQVELQKQIDSLKNSSVMTWQHVNMHGEYDFNLDTEQFPFDFNKIKSLNIN